MQNHARIRGFKIMLKSKKIKILLSILGVLAVLIAVFMGILFGSNIIQQAIIRMMCPNEPGSVPKDYEQVIRETALTTHEYIDGLELDVIEPIVGVDENKPTVIFFHGGYYVGGGRLNQEPYCRLLAHNGFRVVNVDYTLAPEGVYPLQLKQANAALNFISEKFTLTKGFVLAGDSAGAHLAAQTCALVGSTDLQNSVEEHKVIDRDRLLGFIGNCGFYEASTAKDTNFFLIDNALQILLDDMRYLKGETVKQLDITNYAKQFPSALLVCGDKDPFLAQNTLFEDALKGAGVNVSTYFPATGTNELGHEFQCNYKIEESYLAMTKTVEYLNLL